DPSTSSGVSIDRRSQALSIMKASSALGSGLPVGAVPATRAAAFFGAAFFTAAFFTAAFFATAFFAAGFFATATFVAAFFFAVFLPVLMPVLLLRSVPAGRRAASRTPLRPARVCHPRSPGTRLLRAPPRSRCARHAPAGPGCAARGPRRRAAPGGRCTPGSAPWTHRRR